MIDVRASRTPKGSSRMWRCSPDEPTCELLGIARVLALPGVHGYGRAKLGALAPSSLPSSRLTDMLRLLRNETSTCPHLLPLAIALSRLRRGVRRGHRCDWRRPTGLRDGSKPQGGGTVPSTGADVPQPPPPPVFS